MRVATARTCSVISSPARCRSRCMLDAASSSRNTSILLSSHVRLGTWQVFHPPATELGLNNGTGAGQAVVDVDPAGLHADRGECLSLRGEVLRVGGAVRVSGEHGHRI